MLEWNVYVENFNGRKIETFNVFDHTRFLDDTKKNARKNIHNPEAFKEQLRRDLLYYFWAKSEWEIIISAWIRADVTKPIKIDVFDQVMLNWEQFCKYVWDHGAELRRREKKNE